MKSVFAVVFDVDGEKVAKPISKCNKREVKMLIKLAETPVERPAKPKVAKVTKVKKGKGKRMLRCKCGYETPFNSTFMKKKAEKAGVTVEELEKAYKCGPCQGKKKIGRPKKELESAD